jgi:hypothetical protein
MLCVHTLTTVVTAFKSYGELLKACQNGYVPTIFGRTRHERMLIRVLKADGLRVWGNKGKNW